MVTFMLGLMETDNAPKFGYGLGKIDLHVPRYGNYCGPGWTGGEVNGNSFVPNPVDELDAACKLHDWKYGLADTTALTSPLYAQIIRNIADQELIEATANSVPANQQNPVYAQIYGFGVIAGFPVQIFLRNLDIEHLKGADFRERRDTMIGDDLGMQARYDVPQYDAQTPDGMGITRAYVDAYASGDLRTAAQLLVRSGGGNIYPDPADGFYPDAIIRKQAGYEGGVPPTDNQASARDNLRAIDNDNDPTSYPDAIVRKAAGYESAADRAADKAAADRAAAHGNGATYPTNGGGTTSTYKSGTGYAGDHPGSTKTSGPTKNHVSHVIEAAKSGHKIGGLPILLDLNGNGVQITDISKSTQFIDSGNDGLKHRTAWAASGDGVMFFDADNDNTISQTREYVFTEWDPTAKSDMQALRARFDSNNDGKLTAADAAFAQFKVMVTQADGSQIAQSLTQLGITEIRLTEDATKITLTDGSMINGQSAFVMNGVTRTVASAVLMAETHGYRYGCYWIPILLPTMDAGSLN